MENILELAKKAAEAAEVFTVNLEETSVHFESNRLKNVQGKQSTTITLRVIKNGRVGYASASGEVNAASLVDMAVETAQFGIPAQFEFPSHQEYNNIELFDNDVSNVTPEEMVSLGEKLIAPLRKQSPDIVCQAGVGKGEVNVKLENSRGGSAGYNKTIFSMGIEGTLISGTDMLFVGEEKSSCHPLLEPEQVTGLVLQQLEYAKTQAKTPTKQLPVIFTPNGVASALVPALMAAFNGKLVFEGASPLGKQLGEVFFDTRITLWDDATLAFQPESRPCDDEGVPSQRTPLIENGIVANFLYDLQTAGMAGKHSTGSASRGHGLPAPGPSSFVIAAGNTTFDDMVKDIKEGLVVEQLMGAEQGNILGGDFSGNLLLGYKIDNGEITGRVKDTMVSGNVYQLLRSVIALGSETRWVGGALQTPHIYCTGLSVASK